jgi:hypothetical protein
VEHRWRPLPPFARWLGHWRHEYEGMDHLALVMRVSPPRLLPPCGVVHVCRVCRGRSWSSARSSAQRLITAWSAMPPWHAHAILNQAGHCRYELLTGMCPSAGEVQQRSLRGDRQHEGHEGAPAPSQARSVETVPIVSGQQAGLSAHSCRVQGARVTPQHDCCRRWQR